jgi:uncharacterized protein YcaQ
MSAGSKVGSLGWARRQALGWSLGLSGSPGGWPGLAEALAAMEFVQADPIRAPARAQDLILRHRVAGYHAGDLDRAYPDLDVDEDYLYAYGYVARRLRSLLHPRSDPKGQGGRHVPRGRAAEVMAFVRERGPVHPREVGAHFGVKRVRNDWGGQSVATTRMLEQLRYYGVLRVARRENGVRVYEAAPPLPEPLDPAYRLRAAVLLVARTLAPVPEPSLRPPVNMLGYALRGVGGRRTVVRDLLASGDLVSREVDGLTYLWPADLSPVEADPPDGVRFLAPFDPVVWDRPRFEHMWGWAYRFEAYVPAPKRRLGYYAMPLLWRDRVIGWANCARGASGLQVDVGFVEARPKAKRFTVALDEEIARLEAFLGGAE